MARPGPVDPAEDSGDASVGLRLGRSALWAAAAVLAMLGAFAAARSDSGLRRIAEAFERAPASTLAAAPSEPAFEAAGAAALDGEKRRMAQQIATLKREREQVLTRLTALERTLEVTGSIAAAAQPDLSQRQPPAGEAGSLVTLTRFGVDLGSARDLAATRARWITIKAQHGALLEGLRPVVAARETGQGGALELHLIVGPLANVAEAVRLCAALSSYAQPCRPERFDGQQLAAR